MTIERDSAGDEGVETLDEGLFRERPGVIDDRAVVVDEDKGRLTADIEPGPDVAGFIDHVGERTDATIVDETLDGGQVVATGDADHGHLSVIGSLHVGDRTGLPLARASPRRPEPEKKILPGVDGQVDRGAIGSGSTDVEQRRRCCAVVTLDSNIAVGNVFTGDSHLLAVGRAACGRAERKCHQKGHDTWRTSVHPTDARPTRASMTPGSIPFTSRSGLGTDAQPVVEPPTIDHTQAMSPAASPHGPSVSITGTGLFTPEQSISNDELVASLTTATERWNEANAAAIDAGELDARAVPDGAFIEKASGITSRYVLDKVGVLDPDRMAPSLETRTEDQLSIQAEIAVAAISEALAQAGRTGADVDAVILGASNIQRAYPAVAIEVQMAIGARGWAYDMNVACSSATFSIQAAVDALKNGSASCAVVVNPEITSAHNNFELRDFHFIFGDACTALVLERTEDAVSTDRWEIHGTRLQTQFSNNIRNDAGFMNRAEDHERHPHELVFRQNGSRVFKEVCPMVATHITEHLQDGGYDPQAVRRFWLHQANLKMNQLIAKGVLGRVPDADEAPVVLDQYANTSSAGSIIAFHKHRDDLSVGDIGVICSFGAGYSVGSVIVEKI